MSRSLFCWDMAGGRGAASPSFFAIRWSWDGCTARASGCFRRTGWRTSDSGAGSPGTWRISPCPRPAAAPASRWPARGSSPHIGRSRCSPPPGGGGTSSGSFRCRGAARTTPRETRGHGGHPAVGMALTDPADGRVNVRLRGFGESRHLLRGGEVEDGSPGVRHPDGVEGVDGPAPDRLARHAVGGPRRCAVGGKEAEVIGMEIGLREELLDDAGEAPEIGGGHNADGIIRKGSFAAPEAVHQGYRILPQGRRQPVGHVLAVPGGGKI